jgi:hypothetical protein
MAPRGGTPEDARVNSKATDPLLIEALGRASSLELFHLNTLIERMLADPRRIIAVRVNMHLGQTVRFLDWRDGQMRNAKVTAMNDTQVTLFEEGPRREWKLPYVAVEPPPPSGVHVHPLQPPQMAVPQQPAPGRNDFRSGDKVSFDDRYLQAQVGTITRINKQTATIDTGDGKSWRVSFQLLRHVLDI